MELKKNRVYFLSGGELNIGIWNGESFAGPVSRPAGLEWKNEHRYEDGLPLGVAKVDEVFDSMYAIDISPAYGNSNIMTLMYWMGEVYRDVREGLHDRS